MISSSSLVVYQLENGGLWEKLACRPISPKPPLISQLLERGCENGQLMKDVRSTSFINLAFPQTL
jgi:hypothetical protein